MTTASDLTTALLMLLALTSACSAAPFKNGFDLAGALVPARDIASGGPPRDGIPALDAPRFVPAVRAAFLRDEDRVLGLAHNGIAKAYPIAILNWHEIVNDDFQGAPVTVSYCPLAFSGIAYPTRIHGRPISFGTSGLLYNSNLVMYDRQTQSLWPQLSKSAVSGTLKGKTLEPLPLSNTTWADWRRRHPGTPVLATDTGHRRNYSRDPYAADLPAARIRLHPSTAVLHSAHAVFSLWAAHQGVLDIATVDPYQAEDVLVVRPHWDVLILPLRPGAGVFIESLADGAPFGESAFTASEAQPDFDLGGALADLIRAEAAIAIDYREKSQS